MYHQVEQMLMEGGTIAPFPDFDREGAPLSQDELSPDFLSLASDMESFLELESIEEVMETETQPAYSESKVPFSLLPDLLEEVGISSVSSPESDFESNQSLIDEVERYLMSAEHPVPAPEPVPASQAVPQQAVDADKIFHALTTGKVVQEEARDLLTETDLCGAFTTSVVGSQGEHVIIIIAPPSPPQESCPTPPRCTSTPSSSYSGVQSPRPSLDVSDSDIDWTPSPRSVLDTPYSQTTLPRKKYQRKVRAVPPSGPYPEEKGERKKAQNRSAAFKYREKKKAEADMVDGELAALCERNSVLKQRVSEMEIEMKCLRKLMIESGLGVYLTQP